MPYISLDPGNAQVAPATAIGDPLTNEGETLSSFRTELKASIVRDIDPNRVDRWINLAYLHVAAMVTVSEMHGSMSITTLVDQPLYMLPSTVAWIKRIPLNDPALYPIVGGRDMQMIDLEGYRSLPDYPATYVYSPYKWMRYGRMLALWPRPASAAAITIDFRIRPRRMSLDTHSPILPEEFHESILMRARYVAFRALKMFNEASLAQNDFVSSLREILNTDAEEMKGKRTSVSPAAYLRSSYRNTAPRRMRDNDL